jgi:hypothetical protein
MRSNFSGVRGGIFFKIYVLEFANASLKQRAAPVAFAKLYRAIK